MEYRYSNQSLHPHSYVHNDAHVTISGGGLVYATRAKFGTVEFRGRNIRILEDDFGYTYSSAVELKNGNTKWRCSKRNAFKCAAFINTRGDYIVKARSEHNHEPTNVYSHRPTLESEEFF